PVLRGEIDYLFALVEKHRACEYEEGIGTLPSHRGECAVELIRCLHLYELQLNGQGPCRSLCGLQHVSHRAIAESAGMVKRGDAGRVGKSLLEQVETLAGKLGAEERQPGDVPARPRKAGHEPISDGIAHGHHDDGGSCWSSAGQRAPPAYWEEG